jgi:hypothetical protein
MTLSSYPKGFKNGLLVQGLPVLNTYGGNVFWVDSGSGSNGNPGTHVQPFATVDYAIGRCTASNGDMIYVKPGHAETIAAAAGLALDVIGVSIVGLGRGGLRPTFNYTATASTCVISAANCSIQNCLFTGGIDAVVTMFTVSAADCALVDCETRDVTGQTLSAVTTTAAADRFYCEGHVHRGAAAAGSANCFEIVGGDGIVIKDFWIDGDFSVAAIENVTTAATNINIYGDGQCFARTRNVADVIVTLVATTTGNVGPNICARVAENAANITEAFVGADAQFFQPIIICNLDGEVGMNTNITASLDA